MLIKGKSVSILRITNSSVEIDTKCLNAIFEKVGNRHFALYSFNGPMRTGKSFMLNKMIYYLTALGQNQTENWFENSKLEQKTFNWQGGSVRDTTGINIWSEPFFRIVDGQEIAILLIDTQGSFDDNTTMQENSIVFALSALLSSILIYNVMKNIAEDVLQFLQCFTGFAKIATVDEASEQTNEDESFQKLVFLVRDMDFPDYAYGYYDENTCPPGQNPAKNLRHHLNTNSSQPFEVRAVRDQINSTYNDIVMFALPYPGKNLARKDNQAEMDDEFEVHAEKFVEKMFSDENIKPKSIGGSIITGKDFTKFVSEWAKFFQRNGLPEMKSLYETAAQMHNDIARKNALEFYNKEMEHFIQLNSGGVDETQFMAKESEISKQSVIVFRNTKKIGWKKYEHQFEERLQENMEPSKEKFAALNKSNLKAEAERKHFEAIQISLQQKNQQNEEKLNKVEISNKAEISQLSSVFESVRTESADLNIQINTMKIIHTAAKQDDINKSSAELPKMISEYTQCTMQKFQAGSNAEKDRFYQLGPNFQLKGDMKELSALMAIASQSKPGNESDGGCSTL